MSKLYTVAKFGAFLSRHSVLQIICNSSESTTVLRVQNGTQRVYSVITVFPRSVKLQLTWSREIMHVFRSYTTCMERVKNYEYQIWFLPVI